MTYTRRGTQLIATLLATIMILSVFAMPVAASDVDETAEFTYDADEVADDNQELTDTFNITFGSDNADDGDEINITFDQNIVDEEDFSLEDASVVDTTENTGGNISGNISADTINNSNGLDGDDEIVLELNFDGDDDVDIEDDQVNTSVTLSANEQAASKADDYDDTTIAEVDTDETGNGLDNDDIVDVSIDPGEADDLNLALNESEAAWGEDAVNATAEIIDAQENINTTSDTDVNFTVTGDEFDESVTGESTESGTTNITLANESQDIDWDIGTFTVDLEEDESQGETEGFEDDSDALSVYPDDVDVNLVEDSIAADDESDLNVSIEDDSSSPIDGDEVDEVDIDVNLTDFSPGDGDVEDPRLAEIDGDPLNMTIEDADFDSAGNSTAEFNGTTNGTYTLEGDVMPAVDVDDTEDSDSIDVDTLDEISAIEAVDAEHDFVGVVLDDDNSVQVDVVGAEDAFENNITESQNDVNISVGDITENESLNENGDTTLSFDPESISASEVDPDATVDARDNQTEVTIESDDIALAHEAQDYDEGWNLMTQPQNADELYGEDLSQSNGDPIIQTYDGNEYVGVDLDDVDLHSGFFVHGASDDARFGYDYLTDDELAGPGETVTMESGWHLVGSNYNISDDPPMDLNNDLSNVDSIEDSDQLNVWSDGVLVAEPDEEDIDEYDSYWLFIGEPAADQQRVISEFAYDPEAR